jgi:hypothetical protein
MGQFEETNRVANELDPARSHGPLRRVLLAGLVIAFSIGEGAVDANDPQGNPVKAFSSLCVESANGQPGEAVVVNIANTDVVAAGYGSLRSSDDTPVYELPEKEKYSSVNFAPNESVNPNLNIIEVGADGEICYDQGPSKNNVILDEFGVFAAGVFSGEPVRIEDTRIIGDFYPIPIDQIVYGVNDPCTVWFPGTSIYFVFDYNRDNLFDSTRGSEYGCF